MASVEEIQRADNAIEHSLRQADRVLMLRDPQGRAATQRLIADLEIADRRLGRRLVREAARFGPLTGRFTGAQAVVYREQIRVTLEYMRQRMLGLTEAQARHAIGSSMRGVSGLLSKLERQFAGIATPLRLDEAAVMNPVLRGSLASQLRRNATSVDRYGTAMISTFEREMRVGMVAGLSQHEMIESLTGLRGPRGDVSMAARVVQGGQVVRVTTEHIPEGLFRRYRYWAQRIVRTETANAYNDARLQGLYVARETQFPDLGKKILAVFDNRTAPDSIAVHGQTRKLDEPFVDGAGRVYQKPPARPNDRETIIPWRMGWPETAATLPLPPAQQVAAKNAATGNTPSSAHRAAAVVNERARRTEQTRLRREAQRAGT